MQISSMSLTGKTPLLHGLLLIFRVFLGPIRVPFVELRPEWWSYHCFVFSCLNSPR